MSTPAILAALLLGAGAPADTTGLDVLRLMHDAYASRWPTNVTFVQTSTFHEGDSTRVETWYEAIQSGKLRIDFAPLEAGNGVIFRSDSIYRFQGDSLLGSGPLVHPLMVLSRDVYEMPPERTGERLRNLGIDLDVVREDTWEGRPSYVVGAEAGDLRSAQFWVDKERLVFVRLIEPDQQDSTKVQETRFMNYQELGDGWIETRVEFYENGELRLLEEYAEVREGVALDDATFDPRRWTRPGWVKD